MSTVLIDISIIRQCWCLGNTSNAGPLGCLCSRLTTPSTCPFSKNVPAPAEYYVRHCSGAGLGTEISLYSCLLTSSERERRWAEQKRAEMYVGSVRAQEWQEQATGNPVRTVEERIRYPGEKDILCPSWDVNSEG